MKKSLTSWLWLKLCLYILRMKEDASISNHIAEFTLILNNLNRLDVKIEDEDQTLLLFCSLPASYRGFRDGV
jgi:gag-polypeptide of LTR copia-type